MNDKINRLRMVVMESPYDSWEHPLTESLFAKMIGLKLRGYGRVFPYGILAADTTDLISDHLLVCEETPAGLRPLFGNKSVPMAKCELHHLPFPGISVVEEAKSSLHVQAMQQIASEARAKGVDLRYAGSMTIDPSESGNKEWSILLRELFTTIYVNFYQSLPKAEVIAGATLRFKVEAYTKWLGHDMLQWKGQELGSLRVAHLNNEEVVWTHLKHFTFEARQTAKKWQHLWDNRIHIPATLQKKQNQKKAA